MNRRDFLKQSAIFTLLTSCQPLVREPEPRDQSILIVGAGMAGLGAARQLADDGYPVTILEGRDRIGGRLWTSRLWSDAPVDMGASWIHGIRNNPMTDLADEIDAERMVTNYDNFTLYDHDGREISDAHYEELEYLAQSVLWAANNEVGADMTILEAIEATEIWHELSAIERRRVNHILNTTIEQDLAGDISELSGDNPDDSEVFGGDDVLFPDGYGRIAEHLARELDVRLSHRVQHLEYGDDGVTITTDQGTFDADYAVITLPLGVLKKGVVTFNPALPTDKQDAIITMGMGLLNKVFFRFPSVFWDEQVEGLGWISAEKGRWNAWLNMHAYTSLPILLGFNAAHFGRKLESWSDEVIIADGLEVLRTIYGPNIPYPDAWQITRWASDPFAYGSYSFNAVGANATTRETLAQPVNGRLFFAGEATSVDYPATIHGAYLSGLRAAREIQQL